MTGDQAADPALEAAILRAHASADKPALARLYLQAADAALDSGQTDRGAFFLTQAYVFALDAGAPLAATLRSRLRAMRRDT